MRSATLASVLLCALVGTAAAEGPPDATLELRPGPSSPILYATVTGVPRLPASSITLQDGSQPALHPTQVVPYRDGTEPIAIAIVYAGGEVFVGNDDFETEDTARYVGFLHALETGIDAAHLDQLYPADSRVIAISYDDAAHLEASGPVGSFRGAQLGDQHHYRNRIGANLVGGLELAIAQLALVPASRRALIVIGDGNDTNNETAIAELARLKKRAMSDRIQTFSIIYKSVLSNDENVIDRMISGSRAIASTEALPATLATIASQLTDRFYVTFPTTALDHDGRAHELVLTLGADQLDPIPVVLPGEPAGPYFTWWRQLAIGGLLATMLVLAMFLRSRLVRTSSGEPR